MSELDERYGDQRWGFKLGLVFHKTAIRPLAAPILQASILVHSVSTLEALVHGVVADFFRLQPRALITTESDEQKFSLADLQDLGSIQDAVDLAVRRRVDALMWKGFDDWVNWFERQLNIDLATLALDWEKTKEMFERRHLLIHNQGRVNQRYLNRLAEPEKGPPLGSGIALDEEYIATALDRLTTLGVVLTIGAWARTLKGESNRAAQHLSYITYNHLMLRGNWPIVEVLCRLGHGMKCSEDTRMVFQMNGWLAAKRLGKFDDIRSDVDSLDTSAYAAGFKLAQAALLDDEASALQYLADALKSQEMTKEDALEWPILEELREHPRFPEIVGLERSQAGRNQRKTARELPRLIQVAVTDQGRRFHRKDCGVLKSSRKLMNRREAVSGGYAACKVCKP